MSKGPIRILIDRMQAVAKFSGLTVEQVADFYDAHNLLVESSSTGERLLGLTVEGPKRTQ